MFISETESQRQGDTYTERERNSAWLIHSPHDTMARAGLGQNQKTGAPC